MEYYNLDASGGITRITAEGFKELSTLAVMMYGHGYVMKCPWLGADAWAVLPTENIRLAIGSKPFDYANLILKP